MKHNEKGFGAVLVLVILVVLLAIGGVAYLVMQKNDDKKESGKDQKQSTSQTNNESSNEQNTNNASTNTTYVEVKEWGVKVTLRDADKVTLAAKNQGGTLAVGGTYDGVAAPSFKDGAVQDDSCEPGLSLFRSKTKFDSTDGGKKIGDYYYLITGGPGACENDADNQLKLRFLADFKLDNLSAL